MTVTRRDAWVLSKNTTWPEALRWYALAVRSMQARPLSDPTSWAYQAAIHGLANTPPPPGAPWNECQHATWFFLPWHRMYLFHFESIVRAAVVAAGGPQDWALPYWNYEGAGSANQIPPAFRQPTLPDGSPNPLLETARRSGINAGLGLPPSVTTSSLALATAFFTTPAGGAPVGFGGPRTGFAHFGPAPGALENQPHNIVHVAVGGNGLMSNPDTAALDPIFWLHHANIDRLWETWRITMQANPQTKTWLRRTFSLRDVQGQRVKMAVRDVVDAATLGYTYDALPAVAGRRKKKEETMAPRSRPRTVGRNARSVQVKPDGAATELTVGPLPTGGAATGRRRAPRFHLKVTDIEGRANPGVVYGVYVNLPAGSDAATRDRHRVGTVSFFGIEHSTRAGSASPQPLTYTFDATDVVERARAHGEIDRLQVTLLPEEGMGEDAGAAAASTPKVTIGTVALVTS